MPARDRLRRLASSPLLVLAALGLLLYGWRLSAGFLADDYLYLGWAREGPATLLRHVTVDSDPAMIRPLAALPWLLGSSEVAALLLHLLSLALHALNGALVAALALGLGASARAALGLGALFVAFPLFAEPVVWLSASFDLWACALGLGALLVAQRQAERWSGLALACGLFAAALLSKESVLALPLLVPLFVRGPRAARAAAALGAVALVYLAARLLLLEGPGGYSGPGGEPAVWSFDLGLALRNVLLQLPYRLLVPLKRAGPLEPAVAVASALLLVGLALATRPWRQPGRSAAILGALLLALLPALPIYGVGPDHEGSRLLYFPVACLLAAGGALLSRPAAAARAALAALLALWGGAALWNGRAWSDAGRHVRETVAAMAEAEDRFPSGSTVLVDGRDTWRGAYAWRNGLARAVVLRGLRRDLAWHLGTAALVDSPLAGLDRDLFEIGPGGEPIEWTACEIALHEGRGEALSGEEVAGSASAPKPGRAASGWRPAPVALAAPARHLGVRLRLDGCRFERRLPGRIYWRWLPRQRFTASESRAFNVGPWAGSQALVRLPALEPPAERLELAIEVDAPTWPACIGALEILALPAACVPPA